MIVRIKRALAIEPRLAMLAGHFTGMRRVAVQPNGVILVQCVEDPYYFGLFGQIVSSLRDKDAMRVEQFVLRSLNVGESRSWITFLRSRLVGNALMNYKWVRLYRSFCAGVGYRSTAIQPIADMMDFYRAWQCWRNLSDKESLVALTIDGVVVGDLVNDSFLRFKPAPMVDLKDGYLLILLWQAYRDVRRAKRYFSRVSPKLYLTSYSTYIQHGIPVRIALHNDVRVFSFGNYQEFFKELSLEDWVHTRNPDAYAKEFSLLVRQDERLALAETALATRLSGGVDSATAYMKKSAYVETGETVPNVRGGVVIFLHDFYDSPHVYRGMVFPDFWEWVCFTIETLQGAGIPFFVKPHPNQISLSDNVLSDLQQRYPELVMISSGITNKQLVEAGMACAVTVYGTVGHEMAYLGVPTIACGHHPHISFGICKTAKSRAEYRDFLRQATKLGMDTLSMRRESLMFYYMHNLCLGDEMMALRDAASEFRMACHADQGGQELIEELKKLRQLPGYEMSIARMSFNSTRDGITIKGDI
jgi:hypothetical protein